jgi:hypothetical protein
MAGNNVAPACDGAPWELAGGRRPATPKLSSRQGSVLWHCGDAGRSFCSPLNGSGRSTMVRQFGQDLTVSRVTSNASPLTGMAPTGVADLCEAPGMVCLERAATPA